MLSRRVLSSSTPRVGLNSSKSYFAQTDLFIFLPVTINILFQCRKVAINLCEILLIVALVLLSVCRCSICQQLQSSGLRINGVTASLHKLSNINFYLVVSLGVLLKGSLELVKNVYSRCIVSTIGAVLNFCLHSTVKLSL